MGRPVVWTTLVCPQCGATFTTKPCKARHGRRFCSVACRSQAHPPPVKRGNQHAFRGDQAKRMALYYRARQLTKHIPQCNRCDAPAQVTHHRDENWRNNALENLERLCRRCHVAHHEPALDRRDRYHPAPARRRQHERAHQLMQHVQECNRCGRAAEVTHHRDENPANNAVENLERLCRRCHLAHHWPQLLARRWRAKALALAQAKTRAAKVA